VRHAWERRANRSELPEQHWISCNWQMSSTCMSGSRERRIMDLVDHERGAGVLWKQGPTDSFDKT
jgi:hypothetical protein